MRARSVWGVNGGLWQDPETETVVTFGFPAREGNYKAPRKTNLCYNKTMRPKHNLITVHPLAMSSDSWKQGKQLCPSMC